MALLYAALFLFAGLALIALGVRAEGRSRGLPERFRASSLVARFFRRLRPRP